MRDKTICHLWTAFYVVLFCVLLACVLSGCRPNPKDLPFTL